MFKVDALVRGIVLAALPAATLHAQDSAPPERASFIVSNIRVEGLQRVSEGTVFNYLPVNIGDTLTAQRVRESIRALFATGFFRDVQVRRDGTTLIVAVRERPSIESFEISGNKDIKTEDLQKSLRGVGLAAGKTFDRSVLDEVTQYLTEQYFARGKYGVRIRTDVAEQSDNRVKLKIDIAEGKRAKIRQINVIGNETFSDKKLLDAFELKTPNWLSWYSQDDRYSRESLQGDLETLRSYYMDRGYANFRIESQQVSISPEKDDIFITINIDEGKVYKLSDVKIAGRFVVPESELRKYLLVQPGQTFSRKGITVTQELLQNRLGADGFAFAKVDPVPTPNEETGEISLTFFIDPANRAYVRNISFSGVNGINDEVLRREVRQLEGGWLSNIAVERSKQRIQRLPYVKKVEAETTPVPGSPDLVDVEFKVEEGPSAQLGGGIGYSESQSFMLNGQFADSNFLGTGQRYAVELNTGSYSKVYSLSHTQPYLTMDGLSATTNFAYRDLKRLTSTYSQFSTKTFLLGEDIGIPIGERQTAHVGLSVQHAELATVTSSSSQLQDWVRDNGDSYFKIIGSDYVLGTYVDTLELSAGWVYDSRDRVLFPTSGTSHRFVATSTVPGSPLEFMTASYQYQQFFHLPFVPLLKNLPISFSTRLSYGKAFGETTGLPPNRHFFTGGPDSVRGFREGTLGPRDSLSNPYGGDAALSGQVEAILPLPEKFASSARLSLFFDYGQSFFLGDTRFRDKNGALTDYRFDFNEMRTSVGVGVQWLAPLGLFKFSFAYPLAYQDETPRFYGDDIERFQFTIGNAF
jgi:outer membrane protein insertion porin family